MTSPLRRSTRGTRNADATATSPEPSAMSPSASPTKLDRKRKRVDESDEQPTELHTPDQHASAEASNSAVNGHSDASAPADKANGVADDTATQDASQKKQLPPTLQALLGISSSRTTQPPAQDKTADGSSSSKVDELVLLEEDATKLLAIADTLNVADLPATAPQPDVKGKSRSAKTSSTASHAIRAILQPGTPLRDVRARLLSAREPLLSKPQVAQHLRTSQTATPPESLSTDLAHLSSLTLIVGLVDQLACRMRDSHPQTDAIKAELFCADVETRARLLESRMAQTAKEGKATASQSARVHVRSSEDRSSDVEATNRYALHMRLPRGDYFTKAIPLDRDQLKKLDPAQADIVQISAQSEEQMRTLKRQGHVPTPTLGQRLGRSGHRHRSDSKRSMQPKLQPVTFLNYGNYASFAPSYDSSASSISYATSAALWRTSAKAHRSLSLAWGARPFQEEDLLAADDDDDDEEDAETSSAAIAAPAPLSGAAHVDAEGDVAMADSPEDDVAAALRELLDGVDQGGVNESLHKLSEDELITSHLRFNMMLLHRLQEFQWARLRRSYGPGASSRKAILATEEESPSADEEATAALLLESLSALVALQPRAVDLASEAVESLVPHASKLRAFSASSGAIDPDLLGDVRDGFWGALDANVVKSTRTSVVASETPLLLRDDVTVRLADGSGSKAKKTSRRMGPGGTQVEERGRGTLERFASSRTYDQSHDRHDAEPARTTGPLARSPSKGDEAPSASRTPSQGPSHASPMPAHPNMHAAYGPGQAQGMTPQSQRLMPGPNASYAFASPSGGPNHLGRPMQYQQPAYAQSPSR
ncbi:hypothetical protein PANT_22c00112 [Moesziomyces antarcticus T-34]|uniref:Uncharacterized protein n=1 Tax=Pseudozyma antarctica (strain T-34) TaxID=1151754 RepID=M9LSC2_PSEA3|nr:hypothetical protein PANT_22c00112 [Moesziomyces antarcticus T-34]